MSGVFLPVIICVLAMFGWSQAKPTEIKKKQTNFDLLMPSVQPHVNDTYFCHPFTVEEDELYLTDFASHADMNVAHHILIYGCEDPGFKYKPKDESETYWNCGEMSSKGPLANDVPKADVCASGSKIIYAWAMDAPDLHLPKDVGFKVGRKTSIKTLVLQVHYKDVRGFLPPESKIDKSGVTITTTTTPQPKTAGVYLLASGTGDIPPHSTTFMEIACSYNKEVPLHPFAFRVHAHAWGKVVSGYRIRDGHWDELGRQSPQNPQMFYNVTDPSIDIEQGDVLAARCTFQSDENRTISIGSTQNDEMCNFYVMYYVDGNEELSIDESYCVKAGPPYWNWADFGAKLDMDQMPNSVSTNPFTDEVFEEMQNEEEDIENTIENLDENVREKFLSLLQNLNTDQSLYDMEPEQEYEPDYYPEEEEDLNRRLLDEYALRNEIENEKRAFAYENPQYYDQWMEDY